MLALWLYWALDVLSIEADMNQQNKAQRGANMAKTVFVLVCLCGAIFLMQWRDGGWL